MLARWGVMWAGLWVAVRVVWTAGLLVVAWVGWWVAVMVV